MDERTDSTKRPSVLGGSPVRLASREEIDARYPEHAKLRRVTHDASSTAVEFLRWLLEQGYVLCRQTPEDGREDGEDGQYYYPVVPDPDNPLDDVVVEQLVYRWQTIDPEAIDRENADIVELLRQHME
jgi:hypothetical protein